MNVDLRRTVPAWATDRLRTNLLGLMASVWAAAALAAAPDEPAAAKLGETVVSPVPAWVAVPRVSGRITARELGLVINTADPGSRAIGEAYIKARAIPAAQVLRLALPVKPTLSPEEFAAFEARVKAFFKPNVQGLALAWTAPYAVGCNSITSALTLGYDATACVVACQRGKPSPYFNTATSRPFTDLKLRPTMLLAAPDLPTATALFQRGVAADRSLGWRGAPPVNAYFVHTSDAARNVRFRLFPPPGLVARVGVDVHVQEGDAVQPASRVLLYVTGLARVEGIAALRWAPGALADHLTSFGGQLQAPESGQMSALEWIAAGATASYGTVSEPCNHLHKFPHPQVLLLHYVQGASALEAYWKSVAWPQQGVFIGEPLAAPFARR